MTMYYFRLGFVILLLTGVVAIAHALTAQERLFIAAEQGDAGAVKAALKAGAKVNGKEAEGWTALLMAASAGRLEAVKALLAAGANVNAASNKGETPLMVQRKASELSGPVKTLRGHTDWVETVAVSGNRIVSGSRDMTIRIWALENGAQLKTLKGQTGVPFVIHLEYEDQPPA